MQFQVEATAGYRITQRSTAIFSVAALRTHAQTILDERLSVDPDVNWEELICAAGENRFVRLDTGDAKELTVRYSAKVETHPKVLSRGATDGGTAAQADRAVIPYLFPSRYSVFCYLWRIPDRFIEVPRVSREQIRECLH